NSNPKRTVRIRTKGEKAFITIKGESSSDNTTRMEWEKEISVAEALQLLALCEKGIIEKIRYSVHYKEHIFEIDEFFGENSGLIIAEIELKTKEEFFEK